MTRSIRSLTPRVSKVSPGRLLPMAHEPEQAPLAIGEG